MTLKIRPAAKDDEEALSHICLLTADAGTSAEALHDFPELPGLVYAVPYIHLPTTWGFVLEDNLSEDQSEDSTSARKAKQVVGYIVGSTDTRLYEQHASSSWFPPIGKKYPYVGPESKVTDPVFSKPSDIHYTKLLITPAMRTAPEANIVFSPVHVHINILPQYHKQGWGRKLVSTAVGYLRERGYEELWVGMDPRNAEAKTFYTKLGFESIEGADENQLGLRFENFK